MAATLLLAWTSALYSQTPLAGERPASSSENPLAALKAEVAHVLEVAGEPVTEEQERAISLMMEDRRVASEQLFGDLMNFREGPTRGQENDRLRDAIEWMRSEFLTRLRDFLSEEQRVAWAPYEAKTREESRKTGATQAQPAGSQQTQYIRINNNAFTAEDPSFRFTRNSTGGGNRTEVIQRGGQGAWHGNVQVLLKDESLNARNPFARNKPPYQERQVDVDVSGPLIPRRLTAGVAINQNEAENVDTINATLPEGVFALGIGKPQVQRGATTRGTYQFSESEALTYSLRYGVNTRKNQGVGGFTLPSRASDSKGDNWNLDVSQFSRLSSRSIHQARFEITDTHEQTVPRSEALQINVPDAFRDGGAQNSSQSDSRNYIFANLYELLGEKMTWKAGVEGVIRKDQSLSKTNFTGAYTFSSLASYIEGKALTFRVNRGEPLLQTSQFEISFFVQNDWKLAPQLTLMLGARYDSQTSLSDKNNLAPRLGLAYAIGRNTVIRGGTGIFYQRLPFNILQLQRRLDGTRQFEIVIDNPTFPDPFQGGTVRQTYPSVRTTDPSLVAPYNFIAMGSYERTFFANLLLTASFDFNREVHRLRARNVNAPLPSCLSGLPSSASDDAVRLCRPSPDRGNILNLEATGIEESKTFRVSFRQRFSIFNVAANYSYQSTWGDSLPPTALVIAATGGQFTGSNNLLNVPEPLPSDNYNLKADWGRQPFPIANFTGSLNAQLPMGIFLTGSVNANSGRLWTITTGKDDNRDTTINDRPAGVIKNAQDGPNQLSFGFNISKAFFFGRAPAGARGGSRTNINLFANATNAFNRLNRGQPSGVMTSPNFGRSTSALDPRQIEAGFRFQF